MPSKLDILHGHVVLVDDGIAPIQHRNTRSFLCKHTYVTLIPDCYNGAIQRSTWDSGQLWLLYI